MKLTKIKNKQQAQRANRVRSKIWGTKARPRLSVFRSNTGFYVQLIDDAAGKTVVSGALKNAKGVAKVFALGKEIGEKSKKAGINQVVFDRGSYAYHGRVKALADGVREAGVKF